MADPVWVDGSTPLNQVNMTKLQTRDEKGAPSGYVGLDASSNVALPGTLVVQAGTANQILINNDGAIYFGYPLDLSYIYKQGADTVKIDGLLSVAQKLSFGYTDLVTFGAAIDTTLYRSAADTLKSDDGFWALGGLVTKVKAGTPTDADLVAGMQQSGAILVDTTASKIWVRVGTTWKYAQLT